MKPNNKKLNNQIIFVLIAVASILKSYSQERVGYNLYNNYHQLINPASIGSYDYLNAALVWNYQMLGFTGAPMIGTVDISSPIGKSNVSLGGQILIDKIGNRLQNFAYVNFAYRVRLNDKDNLSFGLSAGLQNINMSYTDVVNGFDEPDNQTVNLFAPDFKLGVYYFRDKIFAGFNTNNLIKLDNRGMTVSASDIHYYLHGGYRFMFGDKWQLTPSLLMKLLPGAPLQFDVNLNLMYDKVIGFGLGYRSLNSLLLQINANIGERWSLAYGYNMGLGFRQQAFNHGHELMLVFKGIGLGKKKSETVIKN
jgi:type IX secretion system PorP/SprF family membrane protein